MACNNLNPKLTMASYVIAIATPVIIYQDVEVRAGLAHPNEAIGDPDIRDITDIRDIRDIDDIKEITDIVEITNVTHIRQIRDISNITGIIEMRDITDIKEIRDISEISRINEITEIYLPNKGGAVSAVPDRMPIKPHCECPWLEDTLGCPPKTMGQ